MSSDICGQTLKFIVIGEEDTQFLIFYFLYIEFRLKDSSFEMAHFPKYNQILDSYLEYYSLTLQITQ